MTSRCVLKLVSAVLLGRTREAADAFQRVVVRRQKNRIRTPYFIGILQFLIRHERADLVLDLLTSSSDLTSFLIPRPEETITADQYFFARQTDNSQSGTVIYLFFAACKLDDPQLSLLLLKFILEQLPNFSIDQLNAHRLLEFPNCTQQLSLIMEKFPDALSQQDFFIINESIYRWLLARSIVISLNNLTNRTPDHLHALILGENPNLREQLNSQSPLILDQNLIELIKENKYKTLSLLTKDRPHLLRRIIRTIAEAQDASRYALLANVLSKTFSPRVYDIFISTVHLSNRYFTATKVAALAEVRQLETTLAVKPVEQGDQSFNLQNIYGQGLSQADYRSCHQRMAALVCHALQHDQFSLAREHSDSQPVNLWLLGMLRYDIALAMGSEFYQKFGCFRFPDPESGLSTPIVGRYNAYLGYFFDNQNPLFESISLDFSDGLIKFECTIIGHLDRHNVRLTRYMPSRQRLIWAHSSPEVIPDVLHKAEELIHKLVGIRINPEDEAEKNQLLANIGEIHWWLTQATPYRRGSAAITEAIIKGIGLFHGFVLTWSHPEIPEFMPDCAALATIDPLSFAQKYPSFTRLTAVENHCYPDLPLQFTNLLDK